MTTKTTQLARVASFSFCLVVFFAGCKPKLAEQYCEGGIVNGHGYGGDCAMFSFVLPDKEPTTVGTVMFSFRPGERYVVRRTAKKKYDLRSEAGSTVGSIEQDGAWIHVKFTDDTRTYNLRSDAPGFLI